jgi:general L-amino acid transport system substrate-binding protein
MKKSLVYLAGAMAVLASGAIAQDRSSPTVKKIQARGELLCPGHNGSNPGFMEVDSSGNWRGLDIDVCRAVATAILGRPDKAKFVPMSFTQRWTNLQSGAVDLIVKTTDATMVRDTELSLSLSVPYLYGAFQFIVPADINTVKDLGGTTICTSGGSNNIRYLNDFLTTHGIKAQVLTFEKREEEYAAYAQGRCDADMGWGPNLAILRASQKDPSKHKILPDVLTVGPQVILIPEGDERYMDVINWTLQALFIAEEQGVTAANVDAMKANPPNPVVARLLGVAPGIGTRLGLKDDWAYNVIKAIGNYAELYNRTFGEGSAYALPRGLNALWREKGAIVPMILD